MPTSGLRYATAGLLLAGLGWAHSARAQAEMTVGPDSARVNTSTAVPDSSRRTERLFGLPMTRPKKAGVLSALLPGAGQIYNRKYWKLPLVYGAVGGTVYQEIRYQKLYKEFKTAYANITDDDPTTTKNKAGVNARKVDSTNIYRALVIYRRPRDQYYFYIGIAYALNVLDAVVDAHLKDFDISDDLSLHWRPTLICMPTAVPTPGLSVSLNLNARRPARPLSAL